MADKITEEGFNIETITIKEINGVKQEDKEKFAEEMKKVKPGVKLVKIEEGVYKTAQRILG